MNYTDKKFAYTSGNNFTLTGNNYTGYYNVLSGVPYLGKNEQVTKLVPTETYETDVILSDIHFNRAISDTLSLPYSKDNVTVQPNEFVTAKNLNKIFELLSYNNIYLFSREFITNTSIPTDLIATFGITDLAATTINWYNSNTYNLTSFSSSDNFKNLGGIKTITAAMYNNIANDQNFTLYACTSSAITVLSGNIAENTVGVQYYSDKIRDDLQNIKVFGNITDCALYNDFLFVADAGNKSIYKYDVRELQTSVSVNRRIYVESFGSNYSYDKKLVDPKSIAIDSVNQRLIIYDNSVKKFLVTDLDFNIEQTVSLLRKTETVQTIQYNKFFDTLYIISSENNIVFVSIFDKNFTRIQRTILSETLFYGEYIVKLKFSENNSNYCYIATNYRVIKKLVSDLLKDVGIFLTENLGLTSLGASTVSVNMPGGYNGFELLGSNSDYDIIFLTNSGRVMLINDKNNYASVTFTNVISNYNYSDFKLYNDEYVQANYINKEIYKILKNTLLIKQNTVGNFNIVPNSSSSFIQTTSGNIVYNGRREINGYTYLTDYDFLYLDSNCYNFFLHENERVTPLSINRCFENIYNLQIALLNAINIYNSNSLLQYLSSNGSYGSLVLS